MFRRQRIGLGDLGYGEGLSPAVASGMGDWVGNSVIH